jgi:hypothetical protein
MTREEAKNELEKYVISSISSKEIQHININVAKRVIDELFSGLEKEKEQLKKDRDYWKLSFEKQVEASMK